MCFVTSTWLFIIFKPRGPTWSITEEVQFLITREYEIIRLTLRNLYARLNFCMCLQSVHVADALTKLVPRDKTEFVVTQLVLTLFDDFRNDIMGGCSELYCPFLADMHLSRAAEKF